MEKAAIYTRYSSDKQKSESIEQQVDVCRRYCDSQGYEVARIYSDMAMSGRSDDRPEFKRMILEGAFYDVVVVYKFDRFARNRYDSAKHKKDLKDKGCRLESATEQIGDGIESIILESMLEGMAEYYSAQLSGNTSRGMHSNASKCKVNGMLPYGYENVDGNYSIVEHEAEVVRKAFRLYASNEPWDFESEFGHLTTRRGKKFTRSMVSQMVRNERYRGVYEWKDVRIEDGIPRIVDESLWQAAQTRLGKRRRRTKNDRMLLTGKLFGASGKPSQSQGTKTKYGSYQYYVVDGTYIERSEIEELVASSIRESLSSQETLDKITRIVIEEQSQAGDDGAVCEALEASIKAVERERDNFIEAIGITGANDALIAAMRERERRIDGLRRELEDERKRLDMVRMDAEKIKFVTDKMIECESDETLVDIWVSFVVVFEDHLSIYCNWDRKPATEAAIAAAVACDDDVRLSCNWCPEYDLARTTCTRQALVIVARRQDLKRAKRV